MPLQAGVCVCFPVSAIVGSKGGWCPCVSEGEAEALRTWKRCSLQFLNWRHLLRELCTDRLLVSSAFLNAGGSPGTQTHPAGTAAVCRLLKGRSLCPTECSVAPSVSPGPAPVLRRLCWGGGRAVFQRDLLSPLYLCLRALFD